MAHITRKRVGKYVYLYESVSYRNEDGQPRNKKVRIGKVEPNTGEIVYTEDYLRRTATNNDSDTKDSPEILGDVFKQFIDKAGSNWNGYSAMRQGRGTNALALTPARRLKEVPDARPDMDGKLKGMRFYWDNPTFDVTICAPHAEARDLITSSTAKVQSMIERIFTKQVFQNANDMEIEKASEVHLYIDDYMAEAGIQREKTAQEHITQALYVLVTNPMIWEEEVKVYDPKTGQAVFLTYKGTDGKRHTKVKTENLGHMSPFLVDVNFKPKSKNGSLLIFKDEHGRKYYKVIIYSRLAKYLARTAIAPFYNDLLKLNGNKNPSAMMFGRRILLHWNMNQGKPNENIISVTSLLLASALPFYEELVTDSVRHLSNGQIHKYQENGSGFSRQIVEPFEKDLDALVEIGMLEHWEYCDTKGSRLSDKKVAVADYATFSSIYIKFLLNKHIMAEG